MKNPLLQRREELGLSQEAAAQRAGVSFSTWRNWERSRTCPNLASYLSLAKALHWSIGQVQDAVRVIETHKLNRHSPAA